MRKYFEDLSFVEGVLLFCAFGFAIFLRFYDLGAQGPWNDELASWFYLRNLGRIFLYESHSPFYYFLLRLFLGNDASILSIRAFSAVFSVINLGVIYFLGHRFLDRKKLIGLIILLSFNPADVVYARMARHYSFLLEWALVFFFMIKGNVKTWIVCVFGFIFSAIHIFALIPITVILGMDYFNSKNLRRSSLIFLCSLPIVFYYVIRMLVFGPGRVARNVAWIQTDFWYFLKSTVYQFFGHAYPMSVFYPPSKWFCWTLFGSAIFYLGYRRKSSGLFLILLWVCSIIIIEIINVSWINLRFNRYVIYLSAFLIYALIDSIPKVTSKHLFFLLSLSLGITVITNPLRTYSWDDDVVKEWKTYLRMHPGNQQLVCAYHSQSLYYNLNAAVPCSEDIAKLYVKKPLLFFDFNNNPLLAFYLSQKMKIVYYKNFKHSRIIHFEPR